MADEEAASWRGPALVIVVAVVGIVALLAFQYFAVFLGLVGYHPDVRAPVTSAEKWRCFRGVVFIGSRRACAEGFTSDSAIGTAPAVNLLAGLVAASAPVLVAVYQRRRAAGDGLAVLILSAVIAVPVVVWALVSSFGLLIAPALAD